MKKSELLNALASLNPDETVFFKHGAKLYGVESVEINGEKDGDEPPIFATVLIKDGGKDHVRVIGERRAAREKAERDEAERIVADAKAKADAEEAAKARQAEEAERFRAAVAEEVEKHMKGMADGKPA